MEETEYQKRSYKDLFFSAIDLLDDTVEESTKNKWYNEANDKFLLLDRTNAFVMACAFIARSKKLQNKELLPLFKSFQHVFGKEENQSILLDIYRYYRSI
jgi:hypothetical protein